jgi:hypothetical protein
MARWRVDGRQPNCAELVLPRDTSCRNALTFETLLKKMHCGSLLSDRKKNDMRVGRASSAREPKTTPENKSREKKLKEGWREEVRESHEQSKFSHSPVPYEKYRLLPSEAENEKNLF